MKLINQQPEPEAYLLSEKPFSKQTPFNQKGYVQADNCLHRHMFIILLAHFYLVKSIFA